MKINEIKNAYLKQKIFFAPEYEQENLVLEDFKNNNQTLSATQSEELIEILFISSEINEKFFVADLLYLYQNIDEKFLLPLVENAINYEDPSFCRIFLYPAFINFGKEKILKILDDRIKTDNTKTKKNIEKLFYWLHEFELPNYR